MLILFQKREFQARVDEYATGDPALQSNQYDVGNDVFSLIAIYVPTWSCFQGINASFWLTSDSATFTNRQLDQVEIRFLDQVKCYRE
jgi:hypothetical protein